MKNHFILDENATVTQIIKNLTLLSENDFLDYFCFLCEYSENERMSSPCNECCFSQELEEET